MKKKLAITTGLCVFWALILMPHKSLALINAWQRIGSAEGFANVYGTATSLDIEISPVTNMPWVFYQDQDNSRKGTVKRFNGTSWEIVGARGLNAGEILSTGLAFNPSTGEAYIAFLDVENGYRATVMKFDGQNWLYVGNAGFSNSPASSIGIKFHPITHEPYVSFHDYVNNAGEVMKFTGGAWQNVGGASITPAGSGASGIRLTFDLSDGTPYVTFEDGVYSLRPTVLKFNGSEWEVVGQRGLSTLSQTAGISLLVDSAVHDPFIVFTEVVLSGNSRMVAMKYNGSSWDNFAEQQSLRNPGIIKAEFNQADNKFYLHYGSRQVIDYSYLIKSSDGSVWETVNNIPFTDKAATFIDGVNLVFDNNGAPYISYSRVLPSAGDIYVYKYDTINNVSIYRFWSDAKRGHFYTSSAVERDNIINNDHSWSYEGVAYSAFGAEAMNISPIYRFWSAEKQHHFFTISENEKNIIQVNDPSWAFEGISYYAYAAEQANTTPVYRFWSHAKQGHFFTTSSAEKDSIIATDPSWSYEGIAWYVPAN